MGSAEKKFPQNTICIRTISIQSDLICLRAGARSVESASRAKLRRAERSSSAIVFAQTRGERSCITQYSIFSRYSTILCDNEATDETIEREQNVAPWTAKGLKHRTVVIRMPRNTLRGCSFTLTVYIMIQGKFRLREKSDYTAMDGASGGRLIQ